ncbi:MAG: trehalose-phosphatase [Candidatus Altiarchaeia archaeon]
MNHLFDAWPDVECRIKEAYSVFLFLDYDGTLTPIVERPDLAVLEDKTRDILRAISKVPGYRLCIISGRPLEDVKKLVGLDGICFVGNHGMEAECPDLKYVNPEALKCRDAIKEIHEKLLFETKEFKGVFVENKEISEALHYRMADEKDIPEIRKIFSRVVGPYLSSGKIRTAKNKKTLEVLPDINWNKGKMVLKLLEERAGGDALAIYVGDDRTDEDAFQAVGKNGISVLVSERPKKSHAGYYLKDVNEVVRFLGLLKGLKTKNANQ